ncbi:MAG: hypothetical protein LBU42_04420 [Prevotellaceae bacterium]|jgi:hypothetical protein|nr:hypothetical protein [Prevotellaceae bacterium]
MKPIEFEEQNMELLHPPDTIDGVFADRHFKAHLEAEIKQIETHYCVTLPKGKKWRRTPFNTLIEKGVMTVPGIIAEYVKIKQKTSNLPVSCRSALSGMVARATHDMYDTYHKINCMTKKNK